jgi:hypothetical protein
MRSHSAVLTILLLIAASPLAQPRGSDEEAIRALIAGQRNGAEIALTSDAILWSGAYKRPFVRPGTGEEVPGPRRPAERVPGSQRVAITPVRIEVAKSGDLAYEFSDFVLSFETKAVEHVSFPGSALRVWRKEGTAWKVAAAFMRPHYQEGVGAGNR